jgi:beta-lactamase superfamily II metal-dependent hydrolase
MKITFINVGYGEAILVECFDKLHKDGRFTMLIDGGSNEASEFEGYPFRVRALDYLQKTGIKQLNLVVSTHIHEDHVCGLLQVVKNLPVNNFWCNYGMAEGFIKTKLDLALAENESQRKFIKSINDYNELMELLINKGTIIRGVSGIRESVEICQGLYADILGPELAMADELKLRMKKLYEAENAPEQKKILVELDSWMNNTSIMMRLHAGSVKILLPGDTNSEGYEHIAVKPKLLESDIFKLGHHGQIDSVPQEIMKKINPGVIIACASSDRRYNSANPKLFEAIDKSSELKKGVFLFSDNVNLPPYSKGMKEHSALVINIEESTGKIEWAYE